MRRPILLSATTFLAILGIADSAYLTEHALTGSSLYCTTAGALSGCNIVAQSAYSQLLGIPLAAYGLAFYVAVLILSTMVKKGTNVWAMRLLALASVVGVLFSGYFIFLQLFVIKAVCVYCFASFAFSAGICACVALLMRVTALPPPLQEPLPASV